MVKARLDDPLTVDQLRAVLDYDPTTGVFTWKWRDNFPSWVNARRAGKVACSEVNNGYVRIDINGRHYLAHRLAWFYIHGCWPTEQIDHINEDRGDNRIANLREASHSQNNVRSKGMGNSSSGIVGIYRTKNAQRWVAHVGHGQGKLYLGTFATIEEAKAARDAAARRLHGKFARTS